MFVPGQQSRHVGHLRRTGDVPLKWPPVSAERDPAAARECHFHPSCLEGTCSWSAHRRFQKVPRGHTDSWWPVPLKAPTSWASGFVSNKTRRALCQPHQGETQVPRRPRDLMLPHAGQTGSLLPGVDAQVWAEEGPSQVRRPPRALPCSEGKGAMSQLKLDGRTP